MFTNLQIRGWRQFRDVNIEFHDRLTILTGANGAGKTTLLNLIGRHFGWNSTVVSTPRYLDDGTLRYLQDLWREDLRKQGLSIDLHYIDDRDDVFDPIDVSPPKDQTPHHIIGSITYSNGVVSNIGVPPLVGAQFELMIYQQQSAEGLHIPSHRPPATYYPVSSIPMNTQHAAQVYELYRSAAHGRYHGSGSPPPIHQLKSTLIALGLFGYGNQAVEAESEARRMYDRFQEVLAHVLPSSLGFERLSIRRPEVVLVTRSGDFALDAVSGGLASIIDLAWQILLYSLVAGHFTVTIDEPENHLHPELQRTVLVNLLNAFPQAQFIVASHSPFIVGSVPDSNVYVLDYDSDRRVRSTYLDTANRAGSANEILRDVLGLEVTMPIWVEKRLDTIVEEFSEREFTKETLQELRNQMTKVGLEDFVPDTIARIARGVMGNDKTK